MTVSQWQLSYQVHNQRSIRPHALTAPLRPPVRLSSYNDATKTIRKKIGNVNDSESP